MSAPEIKCVCGAMRSEHHAASIYCALTCARTKCTEFCPLREARLLGPDPAFAEAERVIGGCASCNGQRIADRYKCLACGRIWLPTRSIGTHALPANAAQRKATPIASGVLAYFPRALAAVAHCSKVGSDQHNPGEPLHWAREKSQDEPDALVRHLIDHLASGETLAIDTDGVPHLAKVAWRALAFLEKALEAQQPAAPPAPAPAAPQEVR